MKTATRRGPTAAVAALMVASAVTTVVTTVVTVAAKPAYGCSCMQPEAADVERDRATAVFAGTVTSVSRLDNGDGLFNDSPFPPHGYSIEFMVSDQWKGDLDSTVSVSTPSSSAACGYSFETGKDYLVYTYGEADDMSVVLCGRTNALANAADDIAVLGEGVPGEEPDATNDATDLGDGPVIAPAVEPAVEPADVMDKKSGCQNVGFMQRVLKGVAGTMSQLFSV